MSHAVYAEPARAAESLARGLGWFSIVLGATEMLAPHVLTRALGMEGRETLIRAYGVRELAAGIGILSSHNPAPWMWGRVAGDALDLATLTASLRNNDRKEKVGIAMAAVAGVTTLDMLCAQALSDQEGAKQPYFPARDYSDRVGFPQSPAEMRGVALDFEVPKDFRPPELMRPWNIAAS